MEVMHWSTGDQVGSIVTSLLVRLSEKLFFAVRNTFSVQCSGDTLLEGMYVYSSNDKDIMDETVDVTFDRTTSTISVWHQGTLLAKNVRTIWEFFGGANLTSFIVSVINNNNQRGARGGEASGSHKKHGQTTFG